MTQASTNSILHPTDFSPGGRLAFTYVVSPADPDPRRNASNVAVEVSAVRTW